MFVLLFVCVLGYVSADITGTNPPSGQCLCLTNTGVNVRASACGTVIGSTGSPSCYTYTGSKQICSLSGTSYDFFAVDYGTQTGWIAGTYLDTASSSSCQNSCGNVRIVSRAEWGARAPTSTTPISTPAPRTFIHHSAGSRCYNQNDCAAQVRNIQTYSMDSQGYSDISYNFLVGEDGNAYEGRGWDRLGAHALNYNGVSHGICVIGDFTGAAPNSAAVAAVDNLVACGLSLGKISSSYNLHGHRNGRCTACPGTAFFNSYVVNHPRYGGNLAGSCAAENHRVHENPYM